MDAFTPDRQLRCYITECNTLITPEELDAIKTSKPYITGEKAIIEASGGKSLSQEEFVQARDFLYKFTIAMGTIAALLTNGPGRQEGK